MDVNSKPLRINVLWIGIFMVVLGLSAFSYAAFVPGGEAAAAMAIGGAVAAGLGALARDIVTVDSQPFDANQAAHKERMAALDNESKQALAWHNLVSDIVSAKESGGANKNA